MNSIRMFVLGGSLLLLAGCGAKPAETKSETPVVPTAPVAVTADVQAQLAKADAKDGKVDKVVSKCSGCALGMDGKAEHAAHLGDYTVLFCDHCAEKGSPKDAQKIVMGLKLN
jgi:hypothetical protein